MEQYDDQVWHCLICCEHSEPKPVKCHICDRGFKNIAALNGHMRLHGGYVRKVMIFQPLLVFVCACYCYNCVTWMCALCFPLLISSSWAGFPPWAAHLIVLNTNKTNTNFISEYFTIYIYSNPNLLFQFINMKQLQAIFYGVFSSVHRIAFIFCTFKAQCDLIWGVRYQSD